MKASQKSTKHAYRKVSQLEHILNRRDMYIGNGEPVDTDEFIMLGGKIIKQRIQFNEGLARIVMEPLYNTVDNYFRCKGTADPQKSVVITCTPQDIEIYNDGAGIPVEESEEAGVLIPELVLGHFLAGSNFDDEVERDGIGGRNGIGVKATNAFSKEFRVETFDAVNGKTFTKTWNNNMSTSTSAVVKSKSGKKGYTRIYFKPDFERFSMTEFSPQMIGFFARIACEISLTTGLSVKFNGTEFKIRSLEHYSMYYFIGKKPTVKFTGKDSTFLVVDCNEKLKSSKSTGGDDMLDFGGEEGDDAEGIEAEIEKELEEASNPDGIDDEWYTVIKAATSNVGGNVISLVNGIYTRRGGVHVEEWMSRVLPGVVEKLKRRFPNIQPKKIRNKLLFFVNAQLVNPCFDTQSKEKLVKPKPELQAKKKKTKKDDESGDPYDALYGKVARMPFVTHLKDEAIQEDRKLLSKLDGKKDEHLLIKKAIQANFVVKKKKGKRCTLILTEGDSAAGTAVKALESLEGGTDTNGIFPLRGKLRNTRGLKAEDIVKNAEIAAIVKLIGLKYGVDYTDDKNFEKLNYHKLKIMADQDYDGDHIKGLILNFLTDNYPTLVARNDFAGAFITPIMQIRLKDKHKTLLQFYDLEKARRWLLENKSVPKERPEYFKGLGTLQYEDVIDYFAKPKTVTYTYTADVDDHYVDLAFSKKKADERKNWIMGAKLEPLPYDIENIGTISVGKFIDNELRRFSIRSVQRMIPNAIDGLKECQRKVLFAAFKRNLTGASVKVQQFGGYVAENTAYLHGELNLNDTIINMALSYLGTNNAPLLTDEGNFGSYFFGGKDAAAGRYIHTKLSTLTRAMFIGVDDHLLRYLEDEEMSIEPEWYVPVLPMILVNGCRAGIGTGFSCSVANYNPQDVAEALIKWMDSEAPDEEDYTLVPWFLGFKGKINLLKAPESERVIGYETHGVVEKYDKTVHITELPVPLGRTGKIPLAYYEMIKKWQEKELITNYSHACTAYTTDFTIVQTKPDSLTDKALELVSKDTVSNMVLLDRDGLPHRFRGTSDIIKYWAPIRLEFYQKRKDYLLSLYKQQILEIENKIRFIREVNNEEIELRKRKHDDLVAELGKKKFDKVKDSYDYLLNMSLSSLTQERIDKLESELKKKKDEAKSIKKRDIRDMWKEDIQHFLKVYEDFTKNLQTKMNKAKKMKTTSLEEAKKARCKKK